MAVLRKFVFYFSEIRYYHKARKKNNPKTRKELGLMKLVKKIEQVLDAYYETFRH